MKYLNLTEGFNPYNATKKDCISYESFFFSGGEPHIKLDTSIFKQKHDDVQVTIRIKSSNDFMMLAVASEALFQCGWLKKSYLFIPYFPGARQDRRMIEGEPITARVFASIINELQYDEVEIFDPHSDVTPALIDNCNVITNHKFVQRCFEEVMYDMPYFIIPDAGASKKAFQLLPTLNNLGGYVKCDKVRNILDGGLTGFEVHEDDLKGKDCVIVDDICDGGGTFIGLAKELKKKNAGDLHLVVSHGIFSKGFKELKKYFKSIYTTNSWVNNYAIEMPEIEKGSEIVNIIKYEHFLS